MKFAALNLIVFVHILTKMIFSLLYHDLLPTYTEREGFTPMEWAERTLARVVLIQMLLFSVWFRYVYASDDPAIDTALRASTSGEVSKEEDEEVL